MPAPKRHKSFQDPQAKRRKVDQNEVAMACNKTTPASATSSNPQREAPLQRRNKRKSPAELKVGNKPAGSGRHSSKTKSTQKARTRTKSNPPVKNAKLLKATSASSKNPNSKGTLKRPAKIFKTASTESDEELIRTRKPHCIRKYSNGDRVKRKGSQSHLNEEVLLSDPVQRDHNYGIPSASCGSHSEIEENKRKRVRESTRGPETQRDVKMETQISSEPLPEQSGQMKRSSETDEVQDNSMTTPTDEVSESVNTKPDTKMYPPASPEKASEPIHKQANQNNSMNTPTDEVSESFETKTDTEMYPPASPENALDPIHKQVNQNNSMTTPTDEVSESVNTKPDTKMYPPASPEKASEPIHKQANQNNSMTTPTDEVSESFETKTDTEMYPPASPENALDPIHKQVIQSSETHEEQNDSVTIPTYQVSESVESKIDAYKKSPDPIPELLKQSNETQDMQENSMTSHTDKVNEHLETKVGTKILSPPAIGLVAYSCSSDSECESEGNDRTGVTESIDVKMKTQASSEKASDPVPEQVMQSSETRQMQEDSMTTPTYEVKEDSITIPSESVDTKLDANIKTPPSIVYSEEASDAVPEQVNPEQVNQIYIDIEKVQEDSMTTPTDEVSERLDGTLDAEIISLPPLEASSEETHKVEVSESVETKCSELAPEHVMQSTEIQGDSAPTHADQVSESVDTKLDIEVKSPPPVELSSEETSDNVNDNVSEQVMQSSETQEVQEYSMTTPTDELRESLETKSGAKIKSPPLEVLFSALKESSLCKHPLSHTMRSNVKEFLGVEDSSEITKKDCDFGVTESIECTLDLETPIIVEDMEIGHCVVEVVGENGDEVDSDLEIIDNSERPEKTLELTKGSEEECSVDKSEDGTEKKVTSSSNQDSTNSGKKEATKKTQGSLEKPKKQQMNPQARTKARLAALAEQKAAASKKASRQLNLLALCEEIADDIATDTMLIKTKEEEEQAVTVKAEPSKEPECTPPVTQAETVPITPTPAGPEDPSPAVEPSAEVPAPAKPPAPEPPQRRFFISQVTVPLKIHEKKKLTRFQRLRQVELQRERNMSWTMVKKLKSDQKMIPETEIKPSPPAAAPVQVTTPPPPSASPAAPTVAALSPAPTSPEVTPKVEPPKVEPPKVTPSKGPTLRKRTLPAEPPPMPNGLKAQKAKPVVEYKPYKARPKYSFDDFELDDEPRATVKPTVVQRAAVTPTTIHRAAVTPTTIHRAAVTPTTIHRAAVTPTTIHRAAVTPTTIHRAAVTPTTIQRAAVRPTPTTIQRAAVTPTTIQRAAVTPTPVAENGKHEDSKPTVQKPENRGQKTVGPTALKTVGPTTPKTGHITQKTVGPTAQKTVPTVQKAVETPTPMSKNGKHEDFKRTVQNAVVPTVQKADMPRHSVQKAAVVPIPSPETEQKAEAPPTPKTGEDEDSIAPVSSPPSEEPPRDSVDKEQCEEKPAVPEIKPASPEVKTEDKTTTEKASDSGVVQSAGNSSPLSDERLQKEIKKLKETDKDGNQAIIDAGQKHFGPVTCSVCGMLYSAANPEDESQHLLFHNQFTSAVRYVGWKKERILGEYPDGKIILVLPDDPKYALKKVEEIREMVDNDLGFQQVETKCPSQTKTLLFISNDKKVAGCLIAEHIQEVRKTVWVKTGNVCVCWEGG
uniref:N-acetyltransferase ESCO zinc-finger domain-containing protein n=1 Tax=Hucho hucho TaxID=62062 RepID=A0A4W5RHY6_9TELE